jgi:hypothetical protein
MYKFKKVVLITGILFSLFLTFKQLFSCYFASLSNQFLQMTKTHIFFLSIGFLLLSVFAQAQQKYYVYLTDKNGVEFNPYTYFDQKAIENRTEQGLPLFDETDLPVNENYKRIISEKSDSIGFASRWLNFVTVYLSNENQLKDLQSLGFVK